MVTEKLADGQGAIVQQRLRETYFKAIEMGIRINC